MKIGKDVRISPLAVFVRPHLVKIGSHVAIDSFVVITTALELGDYVHIAPHCSVIGGGESKLVVKDFTSVSTGCRIVCGSENYTGAGLVGATIPIKYRSVKYTTVTLEKYVTLGTNVVVHPGITVGEGTVVGSSALVNKDLEPWGVYVGIPARRIKDRPKEKIITYAESLLKENE